MKCKPIIHLYSKNEHLDTESVTKHPTSAIANKIHDNLITICFSSVPTASFPCLTYWPDSIGTMADDNAPSPSNRRNRFGIVNANKKAALASDRPNILKKIASRTNPEMRDSRVVNATIKIFFKLLDTGIYNNVWMICGCYAPQSTDFDKPAYLWGFIASWYFKHQTCVFSFFQKRAKSC